MRSARFIFAVLLLTLAASSGQALAAGSRRPNLATMDRAVQKAHDLDRPSRVIVRYRQGAGPRVLHRMQARGNHITRDSRGIGAVTASVSAGELRTLAQDSDILGISADAPIRAHGVFSTIPSILDGSLTDVQRLRRTLGLPAVQPGGNGIGVAVIDSGIAPMPDLIGRITAFYDFTAGGVAAFPSDPYGHGTHVAGLIAGNGLMSAGRYVGIAQNARLIGLRVLDANGEGRSSDLLNAIEFAIDNRAALGIDVINLSLGHPVLEPAADDPLVQAVERASAAGIIVVASAGNFGQKPDSDENGYAGITSPGDAPSALTVGALRTNDTETRDDDRIAAFSSRGPTWFDGLIKPDILAPGYGLVAITNPYSTLYARANLRADVPGYLRLSGTSMATAVTSGVVALVLEAQRRDVATTARLSPNAVKALIQYSALPVAAEVTNIPSVLDQGTGGLNAAGAILLARSVHAGAAAGDWWLDSGIGPMTAIAGSDRVWSQQITWGDRRVWGASIARRQAAWDVTWGNPATWGAEVVIDPISIVVDSFDAWGQLSVRNTGPIGVADDHVVWGDAEFEDHVVWGNSEDGDHVVWGNTLGASPVVALTWRDR